MAKFEAASYSQFRVQYPPKLFEGLKSFCASHARPLRVLDLGSGTGFFATSFLQFFPYADVTLVEPDFEMLVNAKLAFKDATNVSFVNASAENYCERDDFPGFDLVLVGSAWHWMQRAELAKYFDQKAVGGVFIAEYQFPKAKALAGLNEWVRREFNLRWRTLEQVPRGTLIELTQPLRASTEFREQSRTSFYADFEVEPEWFWGMIISQSRFLAYEATLPEAEKMAYRNRLRGELANFWAKGLQNSFSIYYEGAFFPKRNP